MSRVFIVDAKRTAIGNFMGTLSTVHPSDFGAAVIQDILKTTKFPAEELDEVIVGNILPAGLGQGIARQVAIKAGIPETVPAYSLNMVCGSGMKTIMNAYANIKCGQASAIIVGGVESMSQAPYLLDGKARTGFKMGHQEMKDHMIHDALTDAFTGVHMGITAENIVQKYGLSREELDAFAYHSQLKGIKAVADGKFLDEIVPITVPNRKGDIIFGTDEYPNQTTNLEKLASLRPAFKKDGVVTAGNSSGINDGASFMLVVAEELLIQYNLTALVEIIGVGQGGVDPQLMGLGPVPAVKAAMKKAPITFSQLELFELNEAFAAQAIAVVKDLAEHFESSEEEILAKCNVNGGAISLGHPVGASGNRITTTLIHEMVKRNAKYGLASLCIGGGMGTAIVLKLNGGRK